MRTVMLCSALALTLSPSLPLCGQNSIYPVFESRLTAPPETVTIAAALPEPIAVLPQAPSTLRLAAAVTAMPQPCSVGATDTSGSSEAEDAAHARQPCPDTPTPYRRFLDSRTPIPLTPMQKGHLALHNLKDPGNLATIVGTAAFTVGTNAHTAYGPGWKGFGRNTAYSLLQDTTGEFFGTFLIPSLTHEDPHYHRMPHASIPRRFVHALSRTIIAQNDDGRSMANYATLLTNPICSEISNLYVPGIRGNGPSTVARILTGYATTPIDNEITEFLPDLAKHIHIQVIFVQRILNPVAADEYALP